MSVNIFNSEDQSLVKLASNNITAEETIETLNDIKVSVATNKASVAADKATVSADKADIVSMKSEIANTKTTIDETAQTVSENANSVQQEKIAIDETKTDIDKKYTEISNTASKLNTKYNNLTSNYYTKEATNSLISSTTKPKYSVVNELPTSDISTDIIYLKSTNTTSTDGIYEMYTYQDNNWVKIGTSNPDLADYYTKELANSTFATKTEINNTNTEVSELKEDLAKHPWYRKVMPYNIFDYTKCMADSTLNGSNGEIGTQSDYSVSDYIEIEENVSYTRNNTSAGTIQCFYDKDKTFISSIKYNREATFSSPTGAKYMRFAISSSTSILSSLMITKGDTISTVFTPYKESFYKYEKYAETSKLKVACLGDSITWGYNDDTNEQVAVPYPSVLKREYGFKEVVNLGISGTTVGGDAQVHDGHQVGSQQNFLSRVDTIPSDTDIICIFGGTNDFGVESYYVPLGTINDTTNLTFYGSLRLLFNDIIPKYIGKKIYYITPIHRQTETKSDNGVSRNLKQYVDAIKEICRYYGVEVIDLYSDGEFFAMNSAFRERYSKSGLHPNQEWYYILGRKIGDRLVEHLN